MPNLPPFIAPGTFTDAAAALAQVQRIYDGSIAAPAQAMQRFVAGDDSHGHVRACYPLVRIHTDTVSRASPRACARLSFGFVAGPGRFRDHAHPPRPVPRLLPGAVQPAAAKPRRRARGGTSSQPIPVHFSFAENDHVEGSLSAERRMLMRDVFDLPDLAAMDDGIANGTYQPRPASRNRWPCLPRPGWTIRCTACATTPAPAPSTFQNFVLFTNYQFYIDEFIALGHAAMADPNSEYIAFVEPGNVVTRRVGLERGSHRRTGQRAATPAANAGLPPGARRPRRHHHGQHRRGPGQCQKHHRPHRRAAPPRLDHAGPLRRPAQQPATG
jgi:AMP nucleosidase